MKDPILVMVLDDEAIVGERLRPVLENAGFQVETFTESPKALKRLEEKKFDILVTDLKMDGPSGLDVLRYLKEHQPETQAILVTGYPTIERCRDTEYLNAVFVTKPFKLEQIVKLVQAAARNLEKLEKKSKPARRGYEKEEPSNGLG